MPMRVVLLAIVLLLLTLVQVRAQGPGPVRARPILGEPTRLLPIRVSPLDNAPGAFTAVRGAGRRAAVIGIVLNHLGELVPNAGTVIIRRLADGQPIAEIEVDNQAQFSMRGFDPGTYAAELVNDGGAVISTTGAFTASAGEVIQLAPVIPATPASGLAAVLGSATDGALNSATSVGLTAVGAGFPVSPR